MENLAHKILVVDDDLRLRELLSRYLQDQGYEVHVVCDVPEMNKALERGFFHLIVLDVMLPGISGLDACRQLRGQENDIPVLMLTAKGDEVDRIIGLEIGADDYLSKPFNPRELVARIKAILRRRITKPAGAPEISDKTIQIGQFVFDLTTRELQSNDKAIQLTTGQYALLKILVSYPNQPFSRDALVAKLNERDRHAFERSIDAQISRLRKIVELDPKHPRYIQTVWGYGYVFVPDGSSQ